MSVGRDAPVDPRFANLDASGTIELCSSLADYGEAGGLSRDLMMQVGRYAEARFGDDLEVLLAVSRMYLLGGEIELSRSSLMRAGRLGLDQARVLPLLDHVLDLLHDPRSAEQALREAARDGASPNSPRPGPQSPRPAEAGSPQGPGAPRRLTPVKAERPGPVRPARSYTPTSPMVRLPGHGPSKPTTPIPRQRLPTPPDLRQTSPVAGARAVAAAPLAEEDVPSQGRPLRTEISRRIARRQESGTPPPGSDPDNLLLGRGSRPSAPISAKAPPGSFPRPPRIRILEPDDERRRLDPYELVGELASGGMATVYLGRLAGAGGFSRFVAIKQLHPHLARDEQYVQMFLDEARLAAGIHNAHVVPILEVGMSKAGYFLVMEFIEGDTLASLTLRVLHGGNGLPAPIALRILLDALAGLHAAHQLTDAEGVHLGLVHRDCTPQNILVGIDGSARLTDFGVARAASRLAITRPQQVKGKVAYLSPEQAHAMELDRRSDIFTMGIVLWEALAGRSLFQADTEATTLSRVVSGPIPAVRSFVPDLPVAIDEVCRRALHRDRTKRFRTAAEMAEALERAATAEGFAGAATPRELGAFVETTMGADLLSQREAVRAALAPHSTRSTMGETPKPPPRASTPSRPPPPSIQATSKEPRGPAEGRGPAGHPAETPKPPAETAAAPRAETPRPQAAVAVQPPRSVVTLGEAQPVASAEEDGGPPPPHRAAIPPPPAQPRAEPASAHHEASRTSAHDGGDAQTGASGDPSPSPSPAAPAATEAAPEPPVKKAEAPAALTRPGPSPRGGVATLVERVTGSRVSTVRGAALAVLLVIILTAPLWLKTTSRMLDRGGARAGQVVPASPPSTTPVPRTAPAPSPPELQVGTASPGATLTAPAPTPAPRAPAAGSAQAWDEGDWLPEAGLGRDDPSASPTAAPAPSASPRPRP